MTGALRDMVDFYDILRLTLEAREAGLIDSVWLSTWRGEFDRCDPGLKSRLRDSGVGVIEGDLPRRDVAGAAWGYVVQATSIANAIERLAPDDRVLKLRTDKCARHLRTMLTTLTEGDPGPPGDPRFAVLGARLCVNRLKATVPFHASDMVYYGRAGDIAALTRPDLWPETLATAAAYGPEGRWLPTPFAVAAPALRRALRRIDPIRFGAAFCDAAAGRRPAAPDGAVEFLALWMLFAHANFSPTRAASFDPALTAEEVFAGARPGGVLLAGSRRGFLGVAPNAELFGAVANGKLPDSLLGRRLADASATLRESAGALSDEAIAETVAWLGDADRPPLQVSPPGPATGAAAAWDARDPFRARIRESGCPGDDVPALMRVFDAYDRMRAPTLYLLLGDAYRDADGLPRDLARARYWWGLAAALRDREAEKRLDEFPIEPALEENVLKR